MYERKLHPNVIGMSDAEGLNYSRLVVDWFRTRNSGSPWLARRHRTRRKFRARISGCKLRQKKIRGRRSSGRKKSRGRDKTQASPRAQPSSPLQSHSPRSLSPRRRAASFHSHCAKPLLPGSTAPLRDAPWPFIWSSRRDRGKGFSRREGNIAREFSLRRGSSPHLSCSNEPEGGIKCGEETPAQWRRTFGLDAFEPWLLSFRPLLIPKRIFLAEAIEAARF